MTALLNGISLGCILFLIGSGLSLVLGSMGIINLAHGALYMVGAYVGWSVIADLTGNFWLAVVAGAAAAAVSGLLMHEVFFKHLNGLLNEQILVSFGLIYIIGDLVKWIWGPNAKAPFKVDSLAGSVHVFGLTYPITRVLIIGVGVLAVAGLWWLQERTRVGAVVRAGMDDPSMVEAMGINLKLVSALLFVVGAAVAGAAGVFGGLVMGAQPGFGINMMLLALVVVVLGGVGSIPGALVGALIVGVTQSVSVVLVPSFSAFSLYVVMAIVLLVRPAGLSGRVIAA